MSSSTTFTFVDNNMEKSSFSIGIADLNAISYTAVADDVDRLAEALQLLTLGEYSSWTMVADTETYNPTRPTSPYANREAGVVVGMVSTTSGGRTRVTIPAPDLTKFPFAALGVGRVEAPFTGLHADLQAFITQLEATAAYVPSDGNVETVTVSYLEHVGRNL